MRKIIPLIFLLFCSTLITNAQKVDQAENSLALKLVDANRAAIGISADEANNAIVSSTFEDKVTRVRYVYLLQAYKGLPVFNQMLVLSFKNDELNSRSGSFNASIEKLVTVSSGTPSVTAESAVQSALSDRGFRASQMAIPINRKDNGRFIEFGDMGISRENITAQLMWAFNEKSDRYELVWQVYLIPRTTSDYWLIRVNALDNSILDKSNLTDYDNWGTPNANPNIKYPAFAYGIASNENKEEKEYFTFKTGAGKTEITNPDGPTLADNADYRVIPIPFEAPTFMPGASTTWHALRSNPWVNATVANATTLKWHTGLAATDYNYTRGNNVWAYHDRTNANTGDPARSATSTTALPNLTFDFTPDYTLEPVVTTPPNQQFNITNLFYWNNLIHDIFYGYGFTEAGGNFQDDNMGRGGVGNDHVNAEAQDGSGSNNANFSTPADGGSGRMQMYLWTAPTPDRDGDVDNGIIIHEFGHGIAKRITGGPANITCLSNSEQGGEGISDYFALMLTQDWSTATLNTGFNSPRGIGTYALNEPTTGPGIRPQRYCTNFSVNNATYATLPGQAMPHGVGWVWCSMLWEFTWELINEIGTITPNIYDWNGTGGNVRALRLVMEGLRTQPCSPGFVDARDHILKADTTLYGGIYYCAIMRAFAKRGVGIGAQQGSVNSITDQVPSFAGGNPNMSFTQNGAAGIPELQNIVYNHSLTASPCLALVNYTLRDTLPLNVTFVSATNGGTYNAGTRVVSWPVNLAINTTGNYGLTVQINAGSYFPPVVLINEPVPTTTISGFWTTASTTANVWIAHNVRSHSAPNSFFTPDAAVVSDQTISTTASFAIGATPPELKFWHWYASESGFDGCVLEISTNGGTTWTDIGAANITQNGYNSTISTAFGNPIGGRQAWSGNSGAFVESKVNLTPYANQPDTRLRWRLGSDNSVSATGWNVDDITAQTVAVVNLRSSLFNETNVRVDFRDTVTIILPPGAVPPTVTIDQAVTQTDPTSATPINFTVVFDQPVIGFATGDVTLTGTAGGTLVGTVTGSGANYNVAVTGMTSSGTVIASIAAGVCTNTALDANVASTSTDNTVTYNLPPPPPGCINAVSFTGPPVPIPDATPAGVDIPITVSGIGTIADLNFRLDPGAGTCDNSIGNVNASIDHTWAGDLIVRLTSPAATTLTLINRRGGSGNNFCLLTLDDDGAFPSVSTIGTAGAYAGNFSPESPLSIFDGENADGVWTLNVSDNAGGDNGNVRGFSLIFTGVAPNMDPVPNDTVCHNATAGPYSFTSSTPGVTFNWTNSNPTIGLAASGTGNIAAFTAVNASGTPVVATITVTPSVGICFGAPTSFTITVLPTGQVNAVPNQTVCKGAPTAPVNFTSTVPGTVFTWTNNNTSIGLAAAGTGNIASFIAQNTGTTAQVATVTVTPQYGAGGLMVTQNFAYTGAAQTWVVPAGVTSINVKSWGGQGNTNTLGVVGGLGGYAEGTLAVTPGQTLYINAGGGGQTSVTGGFNGGGSAGTTLNCANANGGGGGGASDVRVATNTLGARAIVAGGGGGAGGNRVAGCGRGAGGGGGAGYFGGGGGAGWPGTPGSQGPNATGGTQAAGGAGGVTTSTAGATNGTAGASGIGGTGGVEIGSNQGGSSTALPGGTGGGLAGGNGDYVINWTGGSGGGGSSYIGGVTGGVTTAGLQSGNGRVEFTYAAGGISCPGTPITFTITVNPNPSLIVVADPGTTICEGDPTLLTVYNSAGFANMALTQSSSTAITGGNSVSCNAGGLHTDNSYWRAYNLAPLGLPSALTVNTVTFGIELAAGGAQPVTVNIYSQNAGPAFPGGTRTLLGSQAASVPNQTLSLFTVTFATPVVVPSNAVMIVELFTPSGQATGRSFFVGSNAAAQTGPSYLSAVACGVATPTDVAVIGFPNMHIILNVAGTVGSTGSIATGTFLWSPAAGLSSTTSNPVAAAPMNTTTYTVRRTTVPGGCVDSAQITITVNKRPTVTTHPVASVNCATSTATFTVVGTGTALTYQWQQSVTGPGGPWVNVPTTAPYFGGTTATLTINPVSVLMNGYAFRCVLSGTCAAIGTNNISNPAILTVNPLPLVAITPAVSCGGVAGISGTQLTVGSAPPPVPGSVTVSSGTISVPIPDATGDPAISTLTIAGIPANATIGEVKINMNINHTWVGDVDVNIKAPNAAILNLVGGLDGGTGGNSTDNFTNTTFSSLGGAGISGAAAPRTGTFAAEARAGYGPTGYIQTVNNWPALYPTAPVANGVWTIAMGDFVGGDTGTLTSWSMTIDYTTPGGGTGPVLSYVWSPLAGLYTNATATVPYTGTNTPTVYAAPTALTVYTVTATDVATGCFSRATAIVNYTPPAPTVVPAAVTMCLGDPAVKLKSSSSQSFSQTFSSGTVNVVIPDGPTIPPVPTTYPASSSNITVAGVPAGATITGVRARFNITHVYVGDLVMALKAPNGKILNLDAMLNRTNGSGANFTNTVIGSAGTTLLSAGAAPWTGTFRADLAGATFTAFGFTWPGGPVGYVPNAAAYNELYNTGPVNGVWSIGIYDAGAPDGGTLNNWSLDIDYVVGVPATPAVWTPIAGLFSDAAASTAYVAGTAVDSVWARPTPNGVYNYQATVQSMPVQSTFTNPANIVINASGNGTPYPAVIAVSGLPTSAVAVDSVRLTGVSHTWGNDIDILLQSPTGQNVVLMSDIGGTVAVPNATYTFRDGAPAMNANAANPTGTYSPTNNGAADNWPAPGPGAITQAAPALSMFGTANVNGNWNLFVFDDVGGDAGNISGGFTIYFNVSVPACTSPARTVVVTVNLPTTLNANLPASQTVCTDKVATFTAAVATGTGPHSYRWEVSTNSGNPPWTTVANGGVYSGATAATLTITAPPVSMNGYFYRCVVTGAAPCASVTSIIARLGVNPLPTIVISASPYTSLFPGLTTTLSSTVSPAAASSYTWLRNGAAVPNAITGTLGVNVDGLGNYQLRVTDVNGCTNVSNIVTIKDSVSGKCFLYPNPTNGIFQVRYYSVANNVLPRSLTVYDAKGDRVLTRMYTIGRPYDRMDVDMRAFGKGLYWVEIGDRNGNRLAMCRVAIQ